VLSRMLRLSLSGEIGADRGPLGSNRVTSEEELELDGITRGRAFRALMDISRDGASNQLCSEPLTVPEVGLDGFDVEEHFGHAWTSPATEQGTHHVCAEQLTVPEVQLYGLIVVSTSGINEHISHHGSAAQLHAEPLTMPGACGLAFFYGFWVSTPMICLENHGAPFSISCRICRLARFSAVVCGSCHGFKAGQGPD